MNIPIYRAKTLEGEWAEGYLIEKPTLSTSHFPIDGLDYPNKTDRPDITHIAWNS